MVLCPLIKATRSTAAPPHNDQSQIMSDKPFENILIIKLGALGDFIQALGPMKAIRQHHKGAHVTLLTSAPYENFAKDSSYFDSIWIDEKPKWFQIKAVLKLRRLLNAGYFSRVYDLQNNDRTAFYLRLFSPRPEWVGAAYGASHRNAKPSRTAGHAFDGHVETLTMAGITNIEIDDLRWIKATPEKYALPQPFVLLVTGCAPNRPEKRWPAPHYARLSALLIGMGYQPVLIGAKAEISLNKTIAQSVPGIIDLTGQTDLADIIGLGRLAAGAIGNDTGPVHMIAPTGCPVLVLFSKHSNPTRHAPKGLHVKILQKENLEDLKPEDVLLHFEPHDQPMLGQSLLTRH